MNGSIFSVRDSTEGSLNFGAVLEDQAYVQLGARPLTPIVDELGDPLLADEVFVAETNVALINPRSGVNGEVHVYYPGITATPGQALPLSSVFPSLSGTSFSSAGRPAADGGLVYLPLDDGVHLFVAADPSLAFGLGDYNASGQVEQGDLDLVLQNWGLDTDTAGVPSGWLHDLPLGLIEQAELDRVLLNWGSSATPDFGGFGFPGLPEPSAVSVVGIGLVRLPHRRRNRARPGCAA